MERRFVVEAKEFFLARFGSSKLRLEEKRKCFSGVVFWAHCVPLGWWPW
jgi:hypothetical protein